MTHPDDPASPDEATAVHTTPAKTQPAAPSGTQSIEVPGYRIIQRLGEGGMGAVFLAEEVALGRQVAIKIVSDKIARDPEVRARFLREARLLATVEHPNVVRVYTFGEIEDRAYLVMEYVEGETLAERIRKNGPMAPDAALAAVRSIADALATAWEEKVIHRDIKPSNILFDKRGRLRVADFGLAKGVEGATDSSLTQTGYLLGSPHYVSPEQAQGHEADFRSDIYSLGIVLFELITGRKPYEGASAVAVVAKHLHEPLPNVREMVPELPGEIADLIEWMTAKDPAHRPQSYAELLGVLREDSMTPTTPLAVHSISSGAATTPKAPLAAIAIGVIFVLALVFFVQRRASKPHAAEADDGRIAVAIAPFYGPDAESLKEGRYMASMIEKTVATKLGDEVRVIGAEKVGEPLRDHDTARATGERLGATAVIWGEAYTLARETQIQPSVTMIPRRKKVDQLASPQTGGDPYVGMQPAPAVRLGSDATNQVEMRKMSAEGIGDLITFVVASHALREQNDPRKALALLSQMRVTADSQYHKALARVGIGDRDAAARDLASALQLDPQHAQALALLADIDIRAGRWSDAVAHLQAAKATGRPFTSTEGTVFDGKVYFKEWFVNVSGKETETANLLAADPATGRIVERYRLGGIPRTFETAEDALVIRYDIGRTDRPVVETVRFSKGTFDPPLQPPGHLLVRLNSIRAAWKPASNFMWAFGIRAEKIPKPTFSLDPSEKDRYPNLPMTLEAVRDAYQQHIARDATHPAPYVYLGLALWELGDRAGAERAWETALADGAFPTTPYYDYSWIARHLEPLGHRKWADRAYEQVRKRRAAMAEPISTSLQVERLINTPFIRSAGFAARHGGDLLRQHQWVERTRAVTGIALDAEELAAGAWARWFRSKGNEAAAKREEEVARRAAGVSAYFDWLGLADVGFPAILAFGITALVTLIVSIARAARRARPRTIAGIIGRISRGQRAAIFACLGMVLVLVLVQLTAFRKLTLYGLIPLGMSDALGAPLAAMSLDEALATNPSADLRFAAAVSHHLAGHGSRATELYRRIESRQDVKDNVARLKVNRPPEHIPTTEQVVRTISNMRLGMVLGDAFRVFSAAEDKTPLETQIRRGSKIFLGVALCLLVLVAIFSTVPAHEANYRAVRWSIGAALLLFAALAWTMHVRASSDAKDRAVPGFLTVEAMPSLTHLFPLPPMPDVDATEREAWSRSTPMRTFRIVVIAALLLGLALIVRVPARLRVRNAAPAPETAPSS